MIIRVMTVDGQKISAKSDVIEVLPGRHTMSCYISHHRQPHVKKWMPSKTKSLFFLEFSAVAGRNYKPIYVYGDLRSTKYGVLEILDAAYSDAQFEDPVPNIANRTDGCIGCAPYVRINVVDLGPGWNEVFGEYKTVGVRWEVTTSEPIDHIDIRLYRGQSSPPYQVLVKQFTLKPEVIDDLEQIPTSMYFNPGRYDRSLPWTITEVIYKTYEVHASVVDKLGRGSSIGCEQINLKYIPLQDSETESGYVSVGFLDPIPPIGCFPRAPHDFPSGWSFDLPENTIESQYYEYERDGATRYATTFIPVPLVIDGTVGSKLYYTNNDNVSHRLISVYNPVYRETDAERNNGDNPHTIGGVSGIDFGAHGTDGRIDVAPGTTVEITVPPSESGNRHRVHRTWTLWDFVDNSGQIDTAGNIYDRTFARRLKIRVWYPED
jgi:hypothetical protein